MDDLAFGRVIRLARIRRGMTQQELADRAGLSRPQVSRVEHGHAGRLRLDVLRSIAEVLEIRLALQPRTRAIDLDRIVNARHAALAEWLVGWISGYPGWLVRPEVSYSEYGERGVVDLLGWHATSRSVLVIEIKTELVDFGDLLAKLDAKERLAPVVARRFGWAVGTISVGLLVAESTTNRRRAAVHGGLLRAALPDDGRAFARWLRKPEGVVRALRFVADVRAGNVRGGFASPTRVRPRRSTTAAAPSRSGRLARAGSIGATTGGAPRGGVLRSRR
jgi:transcriptional regulator with XRE-family HTH domain